MVTSGLFFAPKYGNFAAFFSPKKILCTQSFVQNFATQKKTHCFLQAFVMRG
jgi:hypothetical protein